MRSERGLDLLNFLLADVQGGVGPFLAIYLWSSRHWNATDIGIVMTIGGLATVAARAPAGALVDWTSRRRAVIGVACGLVAVGAAALALFPWFWPAATAQTLVGACDAAFPPAVAAISLGLVGRAAFVARVGRNEAFNHLGNVTTAIAAGLAGWLIAPVAVLWIVALLACACVLALKTIDPAEIDDRAARGLDDGAAATDGPAAFHPPLQGEGRTAIARRVRRAFFQNALRRSGVGFHGEDSGSAPTRAPPALDLPPRGGGGNAHFGSSSHSPDCSGPAPNGLRIVFESRPLLIFTAAVTLFHFANAAMLPLVGERLSAGQDQKGSMFMAACIVAAQIVMIPMAALVGAKAGAWGRKPLLLAGFAVLPIRGVLYTLSADPAFLIAVQLLDGVGAGLFGALFFIIVDDLTEGSGHYNLALGAVGATWGAGAALSNMVAGVVVDRAGFDAAFLFLSAIAALAFLLLWLAMPETGRATPARPA